MCQQLAAIVTPNSVVGNTLDVEFVGALDRKHNDGEVIAQLCLSYNVVKGH